MTINDVISRTDNLKPNSFQPDEKVRWLSDLDGRIKTEIIDTHEGADKVTFTGYDDTTDIGTELLVPAPYDEIYVRYLEMQIDLTNGELARYENSCDLFNSAYSAFERYYNRTHMPLSKKVRFSF